MSRGEDGGATAGHPRTAKAPGRGRAARILSRRFLDPAPWLCLGVLLAVACRVPESACGVPESETPGPARGGGGAAPGGSEGGAADRQPSRPDTEPYFRLRDVLVRYAGPGREEPVPPGLEDVRLGWFGPSDPADPLGDGLWQAARLAVREANEAGGWRGLELRLVPAWSSNPWGTGIKGVTRLVYQEEVWALVGAPDGPAAHLVEQVTAKARVAFVNPVSTDKTTNLTNVPWIFSCAPGDDRIAALLAGAVLSWSGSGPFALISCTDHDSRVLASELMAVFGRLARSPSLHLEFQPGGGSSPERVASLRGHSLQCVVVIAGPRDTAGFVRQARLSGIQERIFGGPAMGRSAFGEAVEGVLGDLVFPCLWEPSGDRARSFCRSFEEATGRRPDYAEAYTYDAVRLLVEAVRSAGLNRALIRDALRASGPRPGVTGTIRWDPTGHNEAAGVGLATYRDGRMVRLTGVTLRADGQRPVGG